MSSIKRVVFPGTFDPFTVGHQSLIARALRFADELIVAIGVNTCKQSYFPLEKRIRCIERIYRNEPRIKVISYDSLTVDFAGKVKADFILRGVRTVSDFEYEKNMADVNRKLTAVDTLLLFAEPEYAYISSGIVRELLSFGKDISGFVPEESLVIINEINDL